MNCEGKELNMGREGTFLKYLWIEKNGCLEETGFQLDKNYEFEYFSQENIVKISKCKSGYPKNFWEKDGRIVDIYAVVGDNGRGKTTFLRAIMDIFTQVYPPEWFSKEEYLNEGYSDLCALMIVGDAESDVLKALCIGIDEIYVDEKSEHDINVVTDKLMIRRILEKVKIAFLSNVFDIRDYISLKADHISDYSFGGLLAGDFAKQVHYQREDCQNDNIKEQVFHDIYRQVSFMTECYDKLDDNEQQEMFQSWPKELHLRFIFRKNRNGRGKEIYFGEIFIKKLSEFVPEEDKLRSQKSAHGIPIDILLKKHIGFVMEDISEEIKSIPERIKYRLCWETFQNLLIIDEYNSFYKAPNEKKYGEELLPIVTAVYEAIESVKASITEDAGLSLNQPCFFYKILYEKLFRVNEKSSVKEIAGYYADMFKVILSLPDGLFAYNNKTDDFNFIIREQTKSNMDFFNLFLLCYKKVVLPFSFLEFDWGMSSGENHLLSFYARLFAMRKVVPRTNFHTDSVVNYIRPLQDSIKQNSLEDDNSGITCNSLWLLIDEVDLTYHPRWQKKLIADMCRFIPQILPDKNLEIEIIFTTHSPILLGDMPKENVIYLIEESGKIQAKRNLSKNTFGQNIYVLFQDSFFLDDPLGQFASDKLQGILSDIAKIRGQLDKNSKKTCSIEKKNKILKEINDIRDRSRLFGDRVIQFKLLELLDICEYRLNSYVQEINSDEKDSTKRELEWMREKKDWIERQIVELEKK